MKYMAGGNFKVNPLVRLTLIGTLVFFILFLVTTVVMFFSKMGLSPDAVAAYYRGSEEAFTQPRTFGSMLEVTHGHLPVMAMVALLLTHLFIFVPTGPRRKLTAIVTFFGAALLGEVAGWLVRFVHPGFAWLKIACFLTLVVSMAYLIWGLFRLMSSPMPAHAHGGAPHREAGHSSNHHSNGTTGEPATTPHRNGTAAQRPEKQLV